MSPHFVGMWRLQESCAGLMLMVRTVQCKQVNGSESHSLVIRIQMGTVVPTLALPGEPEPGFQLLHYSHSTLTKEPHKVNFSSP